ncbi:MAG: cystathionine beta-lyase [Rickettsiales bacterium]
MKKETLLATSGTNPDAHRGVVNTPVYRASTILFPNLAAFEEADHGRCEYPAYGRFGTPSTEALEQSLAKLEGADYSIVTSSGLAAIVASLLTFLDAGDHLLMVDNTYGPTRRFCDQELKRLGIEISYYDPCIGAGIADLIRENTKVVFVESPGSLTFEVQDIPAICEAAHARGVVVIGDNTWGTPLFFNPFALGMDVSVHSATKYISGHSDLVMGVISCREVHFKKLQQVYRNLGSCPSADNCYLALRGLRTMAVRLKQHYKSGLLVAQWLSERPEVAEVLHPALPDAAGHELWKRDFSGATSLFGIVLKQNHSHSQLSAMLDGLEYFGMGYSWGGFESLIITCRPEKIRTATKWENKGTLLRIHIGLENTDDLIADLAKGFDRLNS